MERQSQAACRRMGDALGRAVLHGQSPPDGEARRVVYSRERAPSDQWGRRPADRPGRNYCGECCSSSVTCCATCCAVVMCVAQGFLCSDAFCGGRAAVPLHYRWQASHSGLVRYIHAYVRVERSSTPACDGVAWKLALRVSRLQGSLADQNSFRGDDAPQTVHLHLPVLSPRVTVLFKTF